MYNLRLRSAQRASLAVDHSSNVAGAASVRIAVSAQGEGASLVVGNGRALLLPVVIAEGFVAVFGTAAAKVQVFRFGEGLVAPVGVGSASAVFARGVGASSISGQGAAELLFSAHGQDDCVLGTALAKSVVQATGLGVAAAVAVGRGGLSLAANGAAEVTTAGVGAGHLRLTASANAMRGASGDAAARVMLKGYGAGARGSVLTGVAKLRISGAGRAALGNAGSGVAQIALSALAYGVIVARCIGSGTSTIPIVGVGVGSTPILSQDSDRIYVTTRRPQRFVVTAP